MNSKVSMFFKSRSFKRTTLNTALSIVVIATVIVLNIIVSALAHKYYWYIDMTQNSVFKLSDEAIALVQNVDAEVNIIFCDDAEALKNSAKLKPVYNTAHELSSKLDNVNIKHLDIYKNPSSVSKYKTTSASKITDTSVIVESGGESKVFQWANFYKVNESGKVWAYDGEYKLISTVLQLTADENPKAYFTVGHGESIQDIGITNIFADAGYEVNVINLSQSDIPEDTRFLIINNPISDFTKVSLDSQFQKSEIEKIDDYLDGFGCLAVFIGPDTGDLPELYSFLKEWGISFDGRAIMDKKNAKTSDYYTFEAEYATGDTAGAGLIKSITSLPEPPNAIIEYATPIDILFEEKGARTVSPILTTSNKAMIGSESESNLDGGKFNVMTLSTETRYVDNQEQYSFVLAAGTSNFMADKYIGQKAYSNSDILHAVMKQTGKKNIPVNLDFKSFDDTSLDITASEAKQWNLAIISILPVTAILFCIAILVRRRHA